MNCGFVASHINEYIDNCCSSVDVSRLESHIKSCESCAQHVKSLKQLKDALGQFPVSVKSEAQWEKIRLGILDGINTADARKTTLFTPKIGNVRFAAAAAVLLMLVSGSFLLVKYSKNSGSVKQYPSFVSASSTEISNLNGSRNDNPVLLSDNSVISTPKGKTGIIKADSASTIEMAEMSRIVIKKYSDMNQTYLLENGSVALHVNKRKSGQEFVIQTPNASCHVVGTRFTVDLIASGSQIKTLLSVQEGCVLFKSKSGDSVFVKAGSRRCITDGNIDSLRDSIVVEKRPALDISKQVHKSAFLETANNRVISNAAEIRSAGADSSTDSTMLRYKMSMSEADSLFALGNKDDAIVVLDKLISSGNLTLELLYETTMKKVRFYKKLNRYNDACTILETIVSGQFRKEYKANALYQAAELKRTDLKDTEAAVKLYRKYIDVYSDGLMIAEVYYTLAEIYHEKKNYSEEASVYKEFIERHSALNGIDRAIYSLAQLYSTVLSDCSTAAGLFNRLESRYPDSKFAEDALFWKANCLQVKGDIIQAVGAYKQYCSKYPDGRWISEARGRISETETAGRIK